MYAGDEYYSDEITSPTHQDVPLEQRLTARVQHLDGRGYVAQVNLNGNWHDVIDYRARGHLDATAGAARATARLALNRFQLNWARS